MSIDLSPADEACLQELIGSLIISGTLRQALEAEGVEAFRTHEEDLAMTITPGAWRAIRRIAPRNYLDLATHIENERRRRTQLAGAGKHHSDAA
jgi:hypothetical protein